MLGNIWTFETENWIVSVDADHDHLVLDEDEMDADVLAEVLPKLESGEMIQFCVVASVTHRLTGMVLAQDYLGGCIYASKKDFRDHVGIKIKSRKDGCNYGSYFSDMVRTVCKDARAENYKFRKTLAFERVLRTPDKS